MSLFRSALLSALIFGASSLTGVATAADRNVEVYNKTKTTLVAFYASRVSTNDWEEDILGDDILEPGQSVTIDVDDGTGSCVYDFKGEFEDGEDVISRKVNVCEVAEFSFIL